SASIPPYQEVPIESRRTDAARVSGAALFLRRALSRVWPSRAIPLRGRHARTATLRTTARAARGLSRSRPKARDRALRVRAAERLWARQFLHARRDARGRHDALPRHRRR